MTEERRDRARAALRGAEYGPLWEQARRRLERNGLSLEGTPLRLPNLDSGQRRAIAGLVGASAAGDRPLSVRLETLDDRLRGGAANVGLIEWLELLGGTIRNRPAEREHAETEREASWSATAAHPVLADRPDLQAWVADVRRSGTATRMAGSVPSGAELTRRVLDVVAVLPADNLTLAQLAAQLTGDAHALDRDQALGRLAHAAIRAPDEANDQPDGAADNGPNGGVPAASGWRRRWARQGVICDELSVSALALNLPTSGADLTSHVVREHRRCGEPIRLTLRQLADAKLGVPPGTLVRICENPSVLAHAATTLEHEAAPLVCVEGVPNTAALALLDLLVVDGAEFAYHGDFDWGGLRITRSIIKRYGAKPWRFGVDDYVAAASSGTLPLGQPGAGVAAPWSPGLVEAMTTHNVAIHEEQVLGDLLKDLAVDL